MLDAIKRRYTSLRYLQSTYSRVLLQQVLVSTVEPLVAPVHGGTVSMGMAAAET